MQHLIICFFLCLFVNNSLSAQSQFDPKFDEFKGTVYKIPSRLLYNGYKKAVVNLKQIDEVSLTELNIPERQDSIPFETIPASQGYGIIFKSTIHVQKTGSHIFKLTSDDGSILWIDSVLVVNNDKIHAMRLKTDTCYLEKGIYPIKIWYMQAIPDRYGLIFEATYYSGEKLANQKSFYPSKTTQKAKKSIVFGEEVLQFKNNSAEVLNDGRIALSTFSQQLKTESIQKVQIIGHTDNRGSEQYNQQLSIERAESVKAIILEFLQKENIMIEVIGKGELEPIANNQTAAGRKQNRRVEIKIF